ncbi:MAG: hypothetical protein AB4352_17550 [Hormoscilla sp.]
MSLSLVKKWLILGICSIVLLSSLMVWQAPAAYAQVDSGPITARPDKYPIYQLGDYAVLVLYTNPVQPYQSVYTWREKDGRAERSGYYLGRTDSRGIFVNAAFLTSPSDCGNYNNEEFAVGSQSNPRSTPLRYIVLCN